MKPILKYAGGKGAMLTHLLPLIESVLSPDATYWEPFVGGGAVAFALQHPRTAINDLNVELMNLYNVIADIPDSLIYTLKLMQQRHSKEYYYKIRALDRDPRFWDRPEVDIAARTVYLNKTCFNGLFRVNSKGYFNTPIGRTTSGKIPDIVQEKEIRELSEFLKHCDRHTGYYDEWLLNADIRPGDVVYMDSPYNYETGVGFTAYQKEGWTDADLIHLKEVSDFLIRKGCYVIISNNSTSFTRNLFSDPNYKLIEVPASRSIGGKGASRLSVNELIIHSKNFIC